MPLLRASASDVTATVKASAQVNAAVGGASSRGGNSAPPPAGGAAAGRAVVTQSAVAKSGSGTFSLLRTVVRGPTGRSITWAAGALTAGALVSLTSSQNGMIAYRAQQYNGLFKSINGGVTWARILPNSPFTFIPSAISCSNDGSKLIVGTYQLGTFEIYTSTNGGDTFTTTTTPAATGSGWVNTYVTGDGSLFMALDGSNFYTSTDGITWTLRSSISSSMIFRRMLVSSNTGSVIYLSAEGRLRKSVDMGVTWTLTPLISSTTIDCSADGRLVVAVAFATSNTQLFISRDSGATFTSTILTPAGGAEGERVECSDSGNVIAVSTQSGLVYLILDNGTATLQTIPGAVAMTPGAGVIAPLTVSGDGSRVIYANANRIFTGTIA